MRPIGEHLIAVVLAEVIVAPIRVLLKLSSVAELLALSAALL